MQKDCVNIVRSLFYLPPSLFPLSPLFRQGNFYENELRVNKLGILGLHAVVNDVDDDDMAVFYSKTYTFAIAMERANCRDERSREEVTAGTL